MWHQLEEAPSYYAQLSKTASILHFPSTGLGRGKPISWPLQQPDLTPFDFSLWGQVKTVLYNSPTETAKELIAMIMGAFQVVQTIPGLFSRVHQSMLHDVAYAMCLGGWHFEHLL